MPVQLFTATDSHTIRFHQLERSTSDGVRNKRVNERTGEEVPLEEITSSSTPPWSARNCSERSHTPAHTPTTRRRDPSR
ncbi:Ku protein [Streptomyces broussonetiae]